MADEHDDRLIQAINHLGHHIDRLAHAVGCRNKNKIRLDVVEIRFLPIKKKDKNMPDTFGLDIPAGQFARIVFAPVDSNGAAAKLDGPVTAVVQTDPTLATVAIGPDGLTVDILLPTLAGSTAVVEVDGEAAVGDVLTTLITARQLGVVVGVAVSLGATAASAAFLPAAQFGVFTAPAAAAKKK